MRRARLGRLGCLRISRLGRQDKDFVTSVIKVWHVC